MINITLSRAPLEAQRPNPALLRILFSGFGYFKKLSTFGIAMVQRLTGLTHVNGLGVEKGMLNGYAWLKVASHDKTPRNKELAQQVYKLLSLQQLSIAQETYEMKMINTQLQEENI